MTREVTEAHYLHERQGLEAILRPPVPDPTALAWIPKRTELLVGTKAGEVHSVDPVLGTRLVASDIGEPAAICVHSDRTRVIIVSRNGTWHVRTVRDDGIGTGSHGLMTNIDAFWYGEYAIVIGDAIDHRLLLAIKDGAVKSRAKLPMGVAAFLNPSGKLMLSRSTPAGLQVIPFGKGSKFPKSDTTGHRLRVSGNYVMGMTTTGVAIWTHLGGQPQSMRMPEVTAAAISPDGRMMGMGTRTGAVALAVLDSPNKRARPDLVKAFEGAVIAAEFATRGRWLATAAERVQLWSWED
ncbi:MAG: hypothetical protein KC912_13470 [Proteobacteria bacterium]|nr:hypothetical protein [Pseudomonadota bacterium]